MSNSVTLKEIVLRWLEEKKHRSQKLLSDETGVNYGTIRNVIEGKAVNGETALRILLPILPIENVHEFIVANYPDMTPFTKTLVEARLQVLTPKTLSYKHNLAALELAFGAIDIHELKLKIGSNADEIIQDLIDADIAMRADDQIRQRFKDVWYSDPDLNTKRVELFLQNLNSTAPGNRIFQAAKGLNREGASKLYTLLEKSQIEVQEVLNNPKFAGELKVATASIMTTF